MFGGAPQGHFLRGAPGVHDQVFQLYISMLEDLIVDSWSAAEYLLKKKGRPKGRPFYRLKPD